MWQFDHATKQQVSYKIYVGVQSHIQALLKKERNKGDVRVCERRENSVVSGVAYRLLNYTILGQFPNCETYRRPIIHQAQNPFAEPRPKIIKPAVVYLWIGAN